MTAKKRANPRWKSDGAATFYLLIGPPFLLLFVITVIPLAVSLWTSLLHWNLADPNGAKFAGLDNFRELLSDPNFWHAVFLTAYQVFGTVTVQLGIGLPIALLLARGFPGARFVRAAYIIPMMMTPVVVGLMWRMLLNTDFGAVNYLLSLVDLGPVDWLGDAHTAMPALIGTDVWMSTPFVVIILLAGLQSISPEVTEAANIDGAGPWRKFWHITLPLLRPMIGLALLFRTMDAIKRFDTIYVMTGGGPGNSTETLDLHAYFYAFSDLQIGKGAAVATVMLAIIVAVSSLLLRLTRQATE